MLYPVYAPNRRRERKGEIINLLKNHYDKCIDLTGCEEGVSLNLVACNIFRYLSAKRVSQMCSLMPLQVICCVE